MNKEYGLMIIWDNARVQQQKIIDDVKKHFQIHNIFEINWDIEKFPSNLSRLYGENLPKNSFKEKEVGTGKFLMLILIDNNPIYKYRRTSKGKKMVNVNFFDAKEMYRSWTGNGHKIHATNDVTEFKHDLMMILGLNIDDYLKKYNQSDEIICYNNNIIGYNGFKDLKQLFYVLNETINYVVLRNYDNLPEQYEIGSHGDIDILTDNYYNLKSILNSEEVSKFKSRVRNRVVVNKENVYMDFRYIGDNYYCKLWEKDILENRVFNKCFYIPNDENFKYSLLYHALIHKKKVSRDYLEKFKLLFSNKNIGDILDKFLKEKGYSYCEPYDISVYFNKKIPGIKSKMIRILYFRLYRLIKLIDR